MLVVLVEGLILDLSGKLGFVSVSKAGKQWRNQVEKCNWQSSVLKLSVWQNSSDWDPHIGVTWLVFLV